MKIMTVGEDRYIIKLDQETNTKTKSGIIIETTDDTKSYKTGTIEYVGAGRVTESGMYVTMQYAPGNKVMFEPRNQIDIMIDEQKHVVVRSTNIICSIETSK